MSDYFHYNEPLSNSDTGQGLIGYFLRVIDATTGAVVPIYADENSTPISSVSGKDNLAQSDADSMVSFYVTPANAYNLDLYAPDGETFLKRYPNVGMASTVGPQGPQGVPGTAGNVDPDLASLKAALTTDVARIYDHAVFKWTTGDYTGQADDANIIQSDNAPLTEGAWVRQLAANIQASDGNTVQANIDNAGYFTQSGTNTVQRTGASKLKEVVSVLDYIPPSEHAAIKAETSTYDCGPAFNQAVIDSLTVLVPQGRYMVDTTIREATNGGARNIIGQNRLKSKLVASPALAASGAPIIWLGNSNGHGNYRLRVQHLYIDGGDTAGQGAAGAIGIRAHEAGTSFVGDLYVTGCSIAIDAIGCIGSSFGGQKTEIYASQKGVWFSSPTGGGVNLGGNNTTQTQSVLTLNTNINNVANIWFGSTSKPVRVTGGLTHVHHLVIQSCGSGASDDLIHLLNANESYDYGGGSHISQIWCEGGNYRSIFRIESTRSAKIDKCFLSGAGALCEQGIVIKGSSGTHIAGVSFRGTWTRAATEGRTTNATFYVHGDSRNGYYGPNYETNSSCNHYIEYAIAGHNNIVIDNHNNSNSDRGLTVGNIRISTSAGSTIIATNPDSLSQLGAVNWYLQDATSLNSFRSTGYVRADTQFQISTTKVIGARKTGWATATGTATRTTFDTASVTLPQLAEHVKALIDDLHATAGHGLIGT